MRDELLDELDNFLSALQFMTEGVFVGQSISSIMAKTEVWENYKAQWQLDKEIKAGKRCRHCNRTDP